MGSDQVVVVALQTFELSRHKWVIAPFKAPRSLVTTKFGGQVLEGTDEKVDSAALDAEGRFRRWPVGWLSIDGLKPPGL
jgi:hypothetical protein